MGGFQGGGRFYTGLGGGWVAPCDRCLPRLGLCYKKAPLWGIVGVTAIHRRWEGVFCPSNFICQWPLRSALDTCNMGVFIIRSVWGMQVVFVCLNCVLVAVQGDCFFVSKFQVLFGYILFLFGSRKTFMNNSIVHYWLKKHLQSSIILFNIEFLFSVLKKIVLLDVCVIRFSMFVKFYVICLYIVVFVGVNKKLNV